MAYTSPGEAAARGIERGMVLGSRLRRDERDEERQRRQDAERDEDRAYLRSQRERTTERQGVLDARQDEEYEFQQGVRQLQMLDQQRTDLGAQVRALAAKYGADPDQIPAGPERDQLERRQRQLDTERRAAQARLYRPLVERTNKKAKEFLSGLQDGRVDLATASPDDLYDAVLAATGRDPLELLNGPDGSPSAVSAAIQGFGRSMESQDEAGVAEAANVILAPFLQAGVGSDGPDGTEIVSKRIVGFVPGPDGKFIPAMSVQVAHPWGRKLTKDSYIAPPTEGRGRDGSARVTGLDPERAFDYVGRLGTLAELVNAPEVRGKIEEAARRRREFTQHYLGGLRSLPGALEPAKKARVDQIQQGNQVTLRISDADDPTKVRGTEVYERGAPPRARGIGGGGAATQLVQGEDEDGNPIWVRVPKQGPAGVVDIPGAAPRSRPESPTAAKADVESQVRAWASKKGWLPNKEAPGGYEKSEPRKDGKGERTVPLTTAERRELEAERVRIEEGRGASRARSAEPGAKPDADRVKTLRTQAEAAIKGGKDAAAVRARFKELTGQDL